ncbi:ABC transporter ATP-binding protein [Microlunatus parietis]|uniref:Iron complex transport system ATP-binding protein n=1 Tax=Microlunatus parietis TaxID=682979 RepID=A0A7Y9I501_9ACTN|nr:ABC transporter ATP-binding protein [Microlunatus parietis]NYE70383.1 iron complex transport system ATP-binding protein [Microlunatus parietis]
MSAPVRVDDVRYAIDGIPLLHGVSLTAPAGRLTGVLGPNGAGKSTLLRLIAGLTRPAAGRVLLGDHDLHRLPRKVRARRVAYLEQQSTTEQPLLVRQVVELGRIPHLGRWQPPGPADRAAVLDALVAVGMIEYAERRWSTLSGGEQQRVQLARALAQQPEVLILDEPTNHLDLAAQLTIMAQVAAAGRTGIAAVHDLNLAASYCDRVVLLSGGSVVAAGTPAEVLTPDVIEEVYGVRPRTLADPESGRPVLIFDRIPAATAAGSGVQVP